MRRRAVITGVGCVTPLGATTGALWDGLTAGRSGVGRLTLFDPENFPVQIAAEVRDWDVSDVGEDPGRWGHCPRQTVFAVGAAIQAVRDSALEERRVDPLRFGVYLGCGEPFEDFHRFARSVQASLEDGAVEPHRFAETALRIFDPEAVREFEPNAAAGHLAGLFNAQGPNANCIAACASSAQAVGHAARIIRRGEADLMLCGGAHSMIHPFGVTGFQRLSALSTRNAEPATAVRPFDRERDGFVIGEGAAIFVLEDLQHALSRGAHIWGEVTGFASSQDAYRVTDTHPDGRGTSTAILRTVKDAALNVDDVDYINAHGTGTALNDRIETQAIKRAFGSHAYRMPISSSKSMLGHATTACGAVELAVCLLTLRHGVIPPTINYSVPDPDCDLDYVPNTARESACTHVLSNSIGFGGQNAALIVSRYDESTAFVARRAA
ncbi:MAG: beta-ketoacyl-[acyl-carrier-protein] synthase family protein [Planctomycetaceae bacterium]